MDNPPGVQRAVCAHRLFAYTALSFVLASSVNAADPQKSPGERAVDYRQSIYTVMAGNFGPLNPMSEGKVPFNAVEFTKHAERFAYIAHMLDDAFPANSNGVANTKAKPEIWTNPMEFQRLLQDLWDKSAAVAVAAKTGDMVKIKAAVQDAGTSCKNCHDKFRNK
jgi:cytochrome c556